LTAKVKKKKKEHKTKHEHRSNSFVKTSEPGVEKPRLAS